MRSSFMIHNSFRNIHLNTAKLLNMVYFLVMVVRSALYMEQDNTQLAGST